MAPTWTLRLAFAVLGVISLSGCSSEEPPLPCAVPDIFIEPTPLPGIILVGQPVRLKVMPNITFSCSGQEVPRPTSVTAEVEGPGGEPVTSQIELGPPDSPAILQFTPVRPGAHHILVAFSQVGGLHQFDLQAALDRSAEPSSESLPVTCESLERTLQGAWACDSTVVRGGGFLGAFSSARLAVAGDVIWVVDGSTVRRYLDNGTTLVLTGSFTHQRGGPEFLLATTNELAVLHTNAIVLYSFKGGVVTAGGIEPWTRPDTSIASGSPYGVLLREGERLAVATRGWNGSESTVQVCPYQLLSGRFQRTAGDCRQLPGAIVGFEPGVLWTRDLPTLNGGSFNSGLIRRWLWAGGQIEEQSSLLPGPGISYRERSLKRTAAVPLVDEATSSSNTSPITAVVSWSPEKKMLFLERLDTEITDPYASPSFYWGKRPQASASEPTKIRTRLPPP